MGGIEIEEKLGPGGYGRMWGKNRKRQETPLENGGM